MGRIGRLIKTEIEKFIVATVETRFKFNQTCDFYAASGDDAPPLADDRIACTGVDGTGNFAAVGVLMVSQGAKPGERIIYSRDEDGNVKAKIHLKNDGGIAIAAAEKATVTIDKDGNVSVKAQKITFDKAGGTFEVKGAVAPTGNGGFCGIPFCPFSGAAHTDSKITITG